MDACHAQGLCGPSARKGRLVEWASGKVRSELLSGFSEQGEALEGDCFSGGKGDMEKHDGKSLGGSAVEHLPWTQGVIHIDG